MTYIQSFRRVSQLVKVELSRRSVNFSTHL